jgi:glycosyltransferase involved in cell wall biosynthesis
VDCGVTLRVGLDVTPELLGMTGVARYSRELRRALEQHAACEVVPFAFGRRSQPVPDGTRHYPVPMRVVHRSWELLGLPRAEQLIGRVDVVHSLDLIPPPTRRPLVVTVLDTVTADLPELHPQRSASMQRRQLASLQRAAVVLAVSDRMAAGLAEVGVEPHRIRVTTLGVSRLPHPADPGVRSPRYVLMVGTLEPRKGHDLLLRAFADARLADLGVVFAGPTGGRDGALKAAAAELGVLDRLEILGPVDDARLAGLYRDATMLCMPSLGEGFGLPVLEAMAAGIPVIASDLPVIREVTADSAVLVPPGDVRALQAAITRVHTDEPLARRLRDAGVRRARDFSWAGTADRTIEAYRAAVDGASGL